MTAIALHPSELAYALSYARAASVIGWGTAPFLPSGPADGDPATWLSRGEARMVDAGRLIGTSASGLNFTPGMTAAILALVDPRLVLLAQRKAGDGLRTMTVHVAGGDMIGLTRGSDGMFGLTRYADLTAAAAACAAFVGATPRPSGPIVRIEADQPTLSALNRMADAGAADAVVGKLVARGASPEDAASAARALGAPHAGGVLSVLYCRNAAVEDAETFSVATDADGRTWIVFPPAGPDGPMVLETSSVAALAARIAVGVAARLGVAG